VTTPADNGIEVNGLVKDFKGGVRAVDEIDLRVAPGEIYGFLGPNGAGKSTTVLVLTTLLPPTSGTARVAGLDVVHQGAAVRRAIGASLQESALDPFLTGSEHMRLQSSLHGLGKSERETRGRELLARVGLTDAAERKVGGYSGGMKRRLDLALALVHRPRILFLDEPTTGLDPQSRLQLWDVIEGFKKGGRTVLLTTHYMDEAERLCDRVGIVDHGKLIALGTPRELIASLGGQEVIEVTLAAGKLDEEVAARLPGVRGVRQVGSGFALAADPLHVALPALVDHLRAAGLTLERLSTRHATLEDVFVALTGRHLRD
jgi:ABC-2 type transport system ATP-binding protein